MTRPDAYSVGRGPDVGALLFGKEGVTALRRVLSDLLARQGSPGGDLLPRSLRSTAVLSDIAEAAADLVEVDLSQALIAGWCLDEQVRVAVRDTLDNPENVRFVAVAEHDVVSVWRPHLDVVLGATTLARLQFELRVTFRVADLSVTIQSGRMKRVETGRVRLVSNFGMQLDTGVAQLAQRMEFVEARLIVPTDASGPFLGYAMPISDTSN